MKKFITLIIVIVLTCSFCSVALAADKVEKDDVADDIDEAKANNSVLYTDTAVYDFRKIASKTFIPVRVGGVTAVATASTGTSWNVKSDLHSNLFGDCTRLSTSKSSKNGTYWSIDKIAVTSKIYQNGALLDSAVDTSYNASYAGAATDAAITAPDSALELRGYHTFEEAGYVSWYPETYDGDCD